MAPGPVHIWRVGSPPLPHASMQDAGWGALSALGSEPTLCGGGSGEVTSVSTSSLSLGLRYDLVDPTLQCGAAAWCGRKRAWGEVGE